MNLNASNGSLHSPLLARERIIDVGVPEEITAHLGKTAKNEGKQNFKRINSNPNDELRKFRSCLWVLCLDQSTTATSIFSWAVFILLAILVPLLNYLFVRCLHCDSEHSHPFELLTNVSESSMAAVSFLCLSHMLRRYGLRKALLLDIIIKDSEEVQQGYKDELRRAFRFLASILLPCFLVESVHKVWWFQYVTVLLPPADDAHHVIKNVISCSVFMAAWLYRTGVFLVICVVFKLLCSLQILRLKGYEKLLEITPPDAYIILLQHMGIREQLFLISHRFRFFMVASLLTITFSQFSALFAVASAPRTVNFFRAGDLVICSAVQVTGCLVCLLEAARITHRAQGIVSLVSQWHALASCTPYNAASVPIFHDLLNLISTSGTHSISSSTAQLSGTTAEYYDTSKEIDAFQKRQALVAYMHHCQTGISLYGFILDRGTLYAIFGIEFSLVLWIFGQTVGIH